MVVSVVLPGKIVCMVPSLFGVIGVVFVVKSYLSQYRTQRETTSASQFIPSYLLSNNARFPSRLNTAAFHASAAPALYVSISGRAALNTALSLHLVFSPRCKCRGTIANLTWSPYHGQNTMQHSPSIMLACDTIGKVMRIHYAHKGNREDSVYATTRDAYSRFTPQPKHYSTTTVTIPAKGMFYSATSHGIYPR